MKKGLAIGYDSFVDLIGNHCYYVDKTRFVKVVMHDKSKVLLITRPRRFGKTLFMDTLNNFLLTSAMRLPSVPRTVHRTAGRWLFARV